MAYFIFSILTVIGLTAIMISRRQPTHNRNWRPDQERLPYAEMNSNLVTIYNIRHNTYRSETDYAVNYYDKTFDLDSIKTIDFIHQPFRIWPLAAHSILSFGFSDGGYISVSVEARRKKNKKYSTIMGLLRQYELIYILADERDLFVLRPLHQKDDVYIYPTKAAPAQARELFLDIINRLNHLKDHPEFYNSLTSTCVTNLIKHANRALGLNIPLSWRVFMPKHLDKLVFDTGLIDTGLSRREAKERFRINNRALKYLNDPDFSRKIRQHN